MKAARRDETLAISVRESQIWSAVGSTPLLFFCFLFFCFAFGGAANQSKTKKQKNKSGVKPPHSKFSRGPQPRHGDVPFAGHHLLDEFQFPSQARGGALQTGDERLARLQLAVPALKVFFLS